MPLLWCFIIDTLTYARTHARAPTHTAKIYSLVLSTQG